jgi:hypothetical protein
MQSDQYAQLMWQNADVTVAPDMAVMSNFYVAQNSATLDIVYRDGSSNQQQKSWLWNIDGMTLPEGGTITEGGGLTGAIRLTPAGGANSNQALLIYPTAGGDGDHIHLTAGGGTTELYLGSDLHYVKLVDGGNVEIRTDDLSGNVGTWNFGANANLTLPETGYLRVGTGIVAGFASSPAPVISGFSSISAENFRFQGNGVNILSAVGAGSYGNTQVASYLLNFDGDIEFTSSTAKIGNVDVITVMDSIQSPAYRFSNGTSIFDGITGTYSNTNVAAYLTTATITTTGNVTAANIITSGATSGNISGANYISANAFQVTNGIFWSNGTAWSSAGGGTTYSNANVAAYLTAGNISVGTAGFTVLPNIVAQFTSNVNSYGQVNMQNINSGTDATTEIIATANNGTDTIFFVDMGIAGNTYDNSSPSNSLGTIIYANDAYLYAQGNTSANIGGNLAIGATTAGRSVTIFAGGINRSSNVATFANTGVTVYGNITAANIITTGTYGNITGANVISANSVSVTTFVRTAAVTFATLPDAVAAGAGARAFITDGNTATFGSQVSGGGANAVPVYSNGTNWYVG